MRRRRELIASAIFALASAACSADTFATAARDGGASDAASDGAAIDGATVADGPSAAATGPRVSCGSSTCKLVDTCCVYANLNTAQYACHAVCPQPQNGDQLSALKCSSTADCLSGEVCCVQRLGSQNVSACSAMPCASSDVQLCDPSAQTTGCQANAPCSSNNVSDWKLPGTFGTCGGLPVP